MPDAPAPSQNVRAIIRATCRHLVGRLDQLVLRRLEEHYPDAEERWQALRRQVSAVREWL